MSNRKWMIVSALSIGLVAVIAIPVYAAAKCTMCRDEAKAMTEKLKSTNMTLAKAIEAAEKRSRGSALTAFTEKDGDKIVFAVYCLTGERVVVVDVDDAGNAVGIEDAENLPGVHDEVAHKPKPKPGA